MEACDRRLMTVVGCKTPSHGVSANAQLRKIKKPMIERRRRERINECLVQLKALVLEAMNKDGSQYNKMEKADILEMTVAHLKTVCSNGTRPRSADSTVCSSATSTNQPPSQSLPPSSPEALSSSSKSAARRYVSGYTECALEVARYLSSCASTAAADPLGAADRSRKRPRVDDIRVQLLEHLDVCLHRRTSGLTTATVGSETDVDGRRVADNESVHHPDSVSPTGIVGWVPVDTRLVVPAGGCRVAHSPMGVAVPCLTPMAIDAVAEQQLASSCFGGGRSRCDSGVYSGASSPTGGDSAFPGACDEPATSPACRNDHERWAVASPSSWTRCSGSVAVACPESVFGDAELERLQRIRLEMALRQQQNALNLTTRSSSPAESASGNDTVWRPW